MASSGCWRFYRRSLTWVLAHPAPVLIALLGTIALNVALIVWIPKGFFPLQDTGVIMGGLQGPQDASFAVMNESVQKIVDDDQGRPRRRRTPSRSRAAAASSNGGFIFVALKPLDERRVDAMQVINRLRPKLMALPVASAFLQPAQDLRIGGRASNALYQYTIQSDTVGELVTWGPRLLAEIRKLPGLQDVNSDQLDGGLQEYLTYDRLTAARLGLTPQTLNSTLYSAFGQSQVSIIYTPLNQYYVVLEVALDVLAGSGGAAGRVCRRQQRRICAAVGGGDEPARHDGARGQPQRAVSVGDGVVQSRPRRLAEPGDGA